MKKIRKILLGIILLIISIMIFNGCSIIKYLNRPDNVHEELEKDSLFYKRDYHDNFRYKYNY